MMMMVAKQPWEKSKWSLLKYIAILPAVISFSISLTSERVATVLQSANSFYIFSYTLFKEGNSVDYDIVYLEIESEM